MSPQNPNSLSNNLNGNISISKHPFIWGNITFLAGVPWLLALSMAGLAVGDPVFPTWFEIFLLGFPAIAAVVWIQWQQPFSPFSLWFLVKPSQSLSEDERRVLTLVKQQRNGWYVTGWVAIAVALVVSAIFCKLYIVAPLAQAITPFPAGLRLFGIIWAEVFFLLSNVFLQSGVSALRVNLTAESEITSLQPFAVEKIKNNFTNIGWRSPQLLKFFEEDLAFSLFGQKDTLLVDTTEQTQDAVEKSQDAEISDAVEETVSESSLEIVESVDEDFEVNNFTEEVVSEEVAIAEDLEVETVETPEQVEIESFISEKITQSEIEAGSEFTTESLIDEENLAEEEEILVEKENLAEKIVELTEELSVDESISTSVDELSGDDALDQTDLKLEAISGESQESTPEPLVENTNLNVDEESQVHFDDPNVEDSEDEVLDIADESNSEEFLELNSDLELESNLESLEDVAIFDGTDLTFEESNEALEQSEIELNQEVTIDQLDTPILDEPNPKSDKDPADSFKKSSKKGFAQKNYGFGKSTKSNFANSSTSEQVESNTAEEENEEVEIGDFVAEEAEELVEIEAIANIANSEEISIDLDAALPIEQIKTSGYKSLDFEDGIDKLITVNNYVENILQDYPKESNEEPDFENQEVEDIIEIASVSEQATDIAEEVLIAEEILETGIPEFIKPPAQIDPPVESIAQESETSQEESQEKSATNQDPQYLLQESLVDKFLAKIEELNNADKSTNNRNLESTESKTEVVVQADVAPLLDNQNLELEEDEFADLEALLNRNIPKENKDLD